MTTRWPAFTPKCSVVLPLPPETWAPPAAAVLVDGVRFEPKRELHVTVIGSALGARLSDATACRAISDAALAAAFETLDWRIQRTHTLLRIAQDDNGVRVETLVEPIGLPALARFHRALGDLLGEALPPPPPHVTLYTRGSDEGIGLPDEATLRALLVGSVDPHALVLTEPA